MKMKWVEVGNSMDDEPMFFIVPDSFDSKKLLLGGYTEDQLASIVVAQAQSSEWANKITDALNGV